jgi:signal peptidase II
MLPLNATSLKLLVAYLLLLGALVCLDQSTKFHAESSFLTWSHPSQILGYRAAHDRVLTLGESPFYLEEKSIDVAKASRSWSDLNVTYVRNPGAAWGSFANISAPQKRALFCGVTLLATVAILVLLLNSDAQQRLLRLGLCFLFAGAVGNFVDRLMLGYVIDWIQLRWRIFDWQVSFPVFNLADAWVHFGLIVLILDLLVASLRKENLV